MSTKVPTNKNEVSFLPSVHYPKNIIKSTIIDFLEGVRSGRWEDLVIPVQNESDKGKRRKLKKDTLPSITPNGSFSERADDKILSFSGFTAIDLDPEDNPEIVDNIESVKTKLSEDDYVYAVHTSCSGRGLVVWIKIDGKRFYDAFGGISEYLYDKYGLLVDQTCSGLSSSRFVCWDPNMSPINERSTKFERYPPPKPKEEPTGFIYIPEDFREMINQLVPYNVCDTYRGWVIHIGFPLVNTFGEGGRETFHLLSKESSKYNRDDCDRKYGNLLKTLDNEREKKSGLETIYRLAKEHGIPFNSAKNLNLIKEATTMKKNGIPKDGIIQTLAAVHLDTNPEDVKTVVEAVIKSKTSFIEDEDSIIIKLEDWLRFNHTLRRNDVTRKIEIDGRELSDNELNTVYVEAKRVFDTKVNSEMIMRVIHSTRTPGFNPFLEFFRKYKDVECEGTIDRYLDCFKFMVPAGTEKEKAENVKLVRRFFKCWLVGIISSAYGQHSPLVLVLIGKQGNGKTEAFRRLLPAELKKYYAESTFNKGKDDEILMTKKIIVMNDEFGGLGKKESDSFKTLTSNDIFNIRAPYDKYSEDLKRLAVLGGTSNKEQVLMDSTGNRRIIPVEIDSIDFNAIDKIDREALFMELHREYQLQYKWRLSLKDIQELNESTDQFEEYPMEYDLIVQYFEPAGEETNTIEELTPTQIMVFIQEVEKTVKLNLSRLGQQLQRLGYVQEQVMIQAKESATGKKTSKRIYRISKKTESMSKHQRLNGINPK